MTKIYVNKFAFTTGVFSCYAEIIKKGFAAQRGVAYPNYFHGKDFWLTEDESRTDFERRRVTKIRSLERQIEKVRNAEFTVKPL